MFSRYGSQKKSPRRMSLIVRHGVLALTLSKVRLGDKAGVRESLRIQGQKQSPRCISLTVQHGELALAWLKARLGDEAGEWESFRSAHQLALD